MKSLGNQAGVNLPALILAAGRGTRIERLAGDRPKPLLEVGGKPLLFWNLEWLATAGVRDVWINLHHRPERIREAIGDGARWGVRVSWSYEPELLGTAGAWKRLAPEWTGCSLVVYGDNFMRFDIAGLVRTHSGSGALATIGVFDPERHPHTGTAGGHVQTDSDGWITGFLEVGADAVPGACAADHVNAGAYILEQEIGAFIEPGVQDFGRDVFPRLLGAGRLRAHVLEAGGFCLGVDTPERFHRAEEILSAGRVRP